MSAEDDGSPTPIINRNIHIKWPCGHELIKIEVVASRQSKYIECPYCIIRCMLDCYDDDKDKLDKKWEDIIGMAEKIMDDL